MKLITVHFDAYKSLVDTTLNLRHPCMALVGINESGKTNVLRAMQKLSDDYPLNAADTPRMLPKPDPSLRFVFALDKKEVSALKKKLVGVGPSKDSRASIFPDNDVTVTYNIKYINRHFPYDFARQHRRTLRVPV